jgi:hypothetical protein
MGKKKRNKKNRDGSRGGKFANLLNMGMDFVQDFKPNRPGGVKEDYISTAYDSEKPKNGFESWIMENKVMAAVGVASLLIILKKMF